MLNQNKHTHKKKKGNCENTYENLVPSVAVDKNTKIILQNRQEANKQTNPNQQG